MKRISLLAVGLLVALMLGCETSTNKPTANSTPSKPTGTAATGNQTTTAQPAPDNTGVNERDRHTAAKTPIDQNENKADVERTADIRKRVLERENMSVNARNVKIITADGKVTLRGPVDSQEEKDIIEGIAHDVAGKDNVDNQIEVAAKDNK